MNNNEVKASVMDIELILKIRRVIYLFIKRLFDFAISIIGIVLILPIAIIVKICYILTGDFHSIFYYQNRVGKDGEVFRMYKFRTMIPDAEEELKKLLKNPKYKKEWEANQKLNDDPRITKIGKILRKTSLDEMPQFFNMFIGQISLIGPRPLVPGELDSHNGDHAIYESVKPGITGWWAANGRSATSYKKRLDLEYYYVKHQGFKLDILCIFRTIKVVFTRAGAK